MKKLVFLLISLLCWKQLSSQIWYIDTLYTKQIQYPNIDSSLLSGSNFLLHITFDRGGISYRKYFQDSIYFDFQSDNINECILNSDAKQLFDSIDNFENVAYFIYNDNLEYHTYDILILNKNNFQIQLIPVGSNFSKIGYDVFRKDFPGIADLLLKLNLIGSG